MNTKRNNLGQFLPNDLLEPLVWVRAEEVKEANEITPAELGNVEVGSESSDLVQHDPPPQTVSFMRGDEEVVVIAPNPKVWKFREGGRKIAPHGQRRDTCSKCGSQLENLKQRYCKKCAAEAKALSRQRQNVKHLGLTSSKDV